MAKLKTMQPKATVAGRSFVFNLVFVGLNVAAVALLVMGFHPHFEGNSTLLLILGFSILAFSIGGILLFKGRIMLSNVARVIVGGLFIVSGLIKANDPIGFSYKLQEYFEDGALAYRIKEWLGAPEFSLEWLGEIALGLSVFICVLEIVLGVMVIFKQKMKVVGVLVVAMMLFFTFLTWHTANCNGDEKFTDRDRYSFSDPVGKSKLDQAKTNADIKVVSKDTEIVIDEQKLPQCVNDCGCFGDALKGSVGRSLTPSESLWKDLVLLYFSIWLLAGSFKIHKVEEENRAPFWMTSLVFIAFLSWVFGWIFPLLFSVILFLGSIWLLRKEREKRNTYWKVIVFVTIISGLVIGYVLMYEPMKDYRPYAVGSDLKLKMTDGQDGQYQNLLVYKNVNSGKIKEYDAASSEYLDSKIWEDKSWKYLEMTTKEIVPMKLASITEQFNPFVVVKEVQEAELSLSFVENQMSNAKRTTFHIYDKENDSLLPVFESDFTLEAFPEDNFTIQDTVVVENKEFTEVFITDDLLTEPKIIVLTVRNLMDANWSKVEGYKAIFESAKKEGVPMIMLVSSNRLEINTFRVENNFPIPTFMNDETELKAIARSNPSLMILKNGKVVGKYPHRAMPDYSWLKKNDLK